MAPARHNNLLWHDSSSPGPISASRWESLQLQLVRVPRAHLQLAASGYKGAKYEFTASGAISDRLGCVGAKQQDSRGPIFIITSPLNGPRDSYARASFSFSLAGQKSLGASFYSFESLFLAADHQFGLARVPARGKGTPREHRHGG